MSMNEQFAAQLTTCNVWFVSSGCFLPTFECLRSSFASLTFSSPLSYGCCFSCDCFSNVWIEVKLEKLNSVKCACKLAPASSLSSFFFKATPTIIWIFRIIIALTSNFLVANTNPQIRIELWSLNKNCFSFQFYSNNSKTLILFPPQFTLSLF